VIAPHIRIKYIISLLLLLFAFAFSESANAQSTNVSKKAEKVDAEVKQSLVKDEAEDSEVTYDTGETINYLSDRMFFQLKKRLHLTDEKDEVEEQKAKKKAAKGTFTIFGITIEKH